MPHVRNTRILLVYLMSTFLLTQGASAGIFSFVKFPGRSEKSAGEPNPPPPPPEEVGQPSYSNSPSMTELPPQFLSPPQPDCAVPAPTCAVPANVSDCPCCESNGCREPQGWWAKWMAKHMQKKRRKAGHSYYCDAYPLYGPRYGHHTTCWRQLPDDCRCTPFLQQSTAVYAQPVELPPQIAPAIPAPAPPMELP